MIINNTTPAPPAPRPINPFFSQPPYTPRPAQGNGVGPRAW